MTYFKIMPFFLAFFISLPIVAEEQATSKVDLHNVFRPNKPTVWESTKKHWKKITATLALATTVAIGGFIFNLKYQKRLRQAKNQEERIMIMDLEGDRYERMIKEIEKEIFPKIVNGRRLQKGAQEEAEEYRAETIAGLLKNSEPEKYQSYLKDPLNLQSLVDEETWHYIRESYLRFLFTRYSTIIERKGTAEDREKLAQIIKKNQV